MLHVRFWQQSDLPYLAHVAAVTTWEITPADDKAFTTYETVAASAQRNLVNILSAPYGTAIVAEYGGRPVGYLLIGLQPHDKTGELSGYLADIYVEKPYRKSGVARQMHILGEEYLRRIGIRRATNWVHAHNIGAQKASAGLGLQPWGVLMVKQLRQSPPAAAQQVPAGAVGR